MLLLRKIQEYLEAHQKTLPRLRREAQAAGRPTVIRIYLTRDLGLKQPPSAVERKRLLDYLRMSGWSEAVFEDPSLHQLTDRILALTVEPPYRPAPPIRVDASRKRTPGR